MSSGTGVLAELRRQPGGGELLELAAAGEDLTLVGGAVRDLLLGRHPKELDVVVPDDAPRLAGELARALEREVGEPSVTAHERFGTASVVWAEGRVDLTTQRAESYAAPGALPDVRAGTLEEDLERRDFTVNALALPLGGDHEGALLGVEHALEDLHAARLRVLHERSFIDDPTRLFRLARYRVRLGFEPEPRTARLASEALAAGVLATVSGARLGAELRLALREPNPLDTLASLDQLGVLAAIAPGLAFDRPFAEAAIALLPPDGDVEELLLASVLLGAAGHGRERSVTALGDLLDELEFGARERERVASSVARAPEIADRLGLALRPSEMWQLLRHHPVEGVALAAALAERTGGDRALSQARVWIEQLRHVRLVITGEDLLAAGLTPGPQIGRRLEAALSSKLDGELPPEEDRRAELRAALEASV